MGDEETCMKYANWYDNANPSVETQSCWNNGRVPVVHTTTQSVNTLATELLLELNAQDVEPATTILAYVTATMVTVALHVKLYWKLAKQLRISYRSLIQFF